MSTAALRPVVIAIAPNGARHGKSDHPNVPLTGPELADTAQACAAAGATMIHLHVRDADGRHSLAAEHYRPAIAAVARAVGERMLIQVTSEAAGVYTPAQQMTHIARLRAGCVSIAVRELFAGDTGHIAEFMGRLAADGTRIQYILYDRDDVRMYRSLVAAGRLPDAEPLLLFVLGRYPGTRGAACRLEDFLPATHTTHTTWMTCAFGPSAFELLVATARQGGHVRIGFENGWQLPDDSIAPDNAALVRALVPQLRAAGCRPATPAEARKLLGMA